MDPLASREGVQVKLAIPGIVVPKRQQRTPEKENFKDNSNHLQPLKHPKPFEPTKPLKPPKPTNPPKPPKPPKPLPYYLN